MNINVGDVNYHVEVVGEGPPLLLLHGFTGDWTMWLPFLSVWETQFRLIMVDIIGHGETDAPKDLDRYSMEKAASDLKEILQYLSHKKVNILGYSMGGRLALTFAATYPNMVNSLILESSSPGLKTEEERLARVSADQKLAMKIMNEGIQSFVDYWESIPLFETQTYLPKEVQQNVRKQRLKNKPIGLANSLLGMGTGKQPSWWQSLHTLSFPVLLLCGEIDQKFCKITNEMDKLLPKSKKMVVKNSGHAIHVEEPQFFGKIVGEYLQVVNSLNTK